MEISSFPLQEDCYTCYLQDSDPLAFAYSSRKRPRCDNDLLEFDMENDSSVQELLSQFLASDTQAECNRSQNVHSVSLDQNNREMDVSDQYYHYDGLSIADSGKSKRARSEVDSAATTSDESSSQAVGGPQRRLWVKNRSKAWWEQVNSPDFPEEEFKKAFRMSRATFDMICEELECVITKKDTMLRQAIPCRQRVAVCLWKLATGEALREVSRRFGLGISTCHKIILEVCTAIKAVLIPKFLQWPDEHKTRGIVSEFGALSGIPNVCGSMYTTHIPIIAPKVSVAAYFNKRQTERSQKTSYSITVQGVVDPRGVFTDISIGWPGSMTNDQVLEKSALFEMANNGALKDNWVVGNLGYSLMDWLLVPYTHKNLTWAQHAYNEKIEEVERVAKEAFMRLKARWSCLQKRAEMKLEDLPVVLGAACVLHNICEIRNEGLSPELQFELFDDEIIPENGSRSAYAMNTRDQIAHKLLHHNLAGSSFL